AGARGPGLQRHPEAGESERHHAHPGECPRPGLRPTTDDSESSTPATPDRRTAAMKIVPLNDKIVVERLEADDKTAGGILLPATAKEKPKQGKVLSVGDGKLLENGKRAAFQVKPGDRVLFTSYAGSEVTVDGKEYMVMTEDDLLAVVD